MDDEQKRIIQSQNGDHEAFESLVTQYRPMIDSLCYRMTGSMADAQDLMQETFVQAYQNLKSFRAEARFSSWLFRIAINLSLNWQKENRRRAQLHADFAEQSINTTSSEDPRTAPIQSALTKLPPKERAAVALTIYQGLTHAEAAQALGCPESTVSWWHLSARRKLKELLAAPRPDDP